DAANRAAAPADEARRVGMAAEARLSRARTVLADSKDRTDQAKQDEQDAADALVDAEKALTDQEERATAAAEAGRNDLAAATEALEQTETRIAEILGEEPEPEFRARAAARLNHPVHDPASAVSVVCTTPDAVPPGPYDLLVVDAAERITDGDLLLGAVQARRWVLVGTPGGEGPQVDHELVDLLSALAALRLAGNGGQTQVVGAETYGMPVKNEMERLRTSGLWDTVYAELYGKIVRRLNALGLASDVALTAAVTERLATGPFQRCLETGS
ncbi:hypothetical protein, partial [Actinocorallia lasiicapitis]